MKHIETDGELPLSAFRKISLGNWRHPRDPQTYAELELNVEPAEHFLAQKQAGPALSLTHYVAKVAGVKYTLNLAAKAPGMQEDRFGSMIITNIGALGLQCSFTPLTPVARTAFLAAVGKPYDGVVVKGGEVCVQRRVKIGFTFDHRYIDGYHGARLIRHFIKVFETPERYPQVFEGSAG